MNHASPCVHGDVVGDHAQNLPALPGKKRVVEPQILHRVPGKMGDGRGVRKSAFCGNILGELFGHDIDGVGSLQRYVFLGRMKRDCQGSGKRPRSRRPDDGKDGLAGAGQCRIDRSRIRLQAIPHPYSRAGMGFVFHLGLSQRGAVVHAPVHGAQSLINESLFKEVIKSCEHDRLVLGGHGRIRLLKSSQNADPLELLALQIEKFLRVFSTLQADIHRLHLQLFPAQLLVNFDFDRQPVAVPAGNVRGVESCHVLRLNHEVLKALIKSVAQVDRAIGVGGPIVQNVGRSAFAGLPDAIVQSHLLPAGERFRLVLWKVGLHGKAGFRQVDGRFQVHGHLRASPNC